MRIKGMDGQEHNVTGQGQGNLNTVLGAIGTAGVLGGNRCGGGLFGGLFGGGCNDNCDTVSHGVNWLMLSVLQHVRDVNMLLKPHVRKLRLFLQKAVVLMIRLQVWLTKPIKGLLQLGMVLAVWMQRFNALKKNLDGYVRKVTVICVRAKNTLIVVLQRKLNCVRLAMITLLHGRRESLTRRLMEH